MLLHILARGKIGRSSEAELVDRYLKRISWPVRVTELPDTGGKLPAFSATPAVTVMLDEPSSELARQLTNLLVTARFDVGEAQ